jgi:serine/threonine protein kinase
MPPPEEQRRKPNDDSPGQVDGSRQAGAGGPEPDTGDPVDNGEQPPVDAPQPAGAGTEAGGSLAARQQAEQARGAQPGADKGQAKLARIKLLGSQVGHQLKVGKRIGRGTLGEVHTGIHPILSRRFAVKIIRKALTKEDEAVHERLKSMVQDASQVEHPNIVSLLDFGQLPNQRFYIVMELARGVPLARALAESDRFSAVRTVSLLIQLAEALEAAHKLRLVHGDVKPSNIHILERHDGDLLKLADLGLVQALSRERTQDDPVAHLRCCSTLSYVSPEQIAGKHLDPRADVYSFGAVAYHMLTGSPPFSGAPAQVVKAHRMEQPEPPSAKVQAKVIPPPLEALVLRCLQKHPQDRFDGLAGVVQQLAVILEGIQQQSFDLAGTPPPMPRRRHRTSQMVQMVPVMENDEEEPLPESQDQLWRLFFDGLFHLGEKVTEAGKGSDEMDDELDRLRQLRIEFQGGLERCDDTERRAEVVRQQMRERESTLRYAIIDLNLMLSDSVRQGTEDPEQADIKFQITELERSLGRIEKEFASKFQELNAELRQHREGLKPLEQKMAKHYRKLYAMLDDVRDMVTSPEAQQLYRLIKRCRNAITQNLEAV